MTPSLLVAREYFNMAIKRRSGDKRRTKFRSDPVAAAGQSVSGFSIDGPNISIVNPSTTQDSSGNIVPPGSSIMSVGPNSATINASYIKTGVLDANLMRTGQIQTIASWNSRSYGSDFDAIEAQQGFTGGYVYLQDWSTVSENTVYAEFAPWGTYESGTTTATVGASAMFEVGDYVRVTGAYFGDPDNLTRSIGQNANVGIIDQNDGPLGYGEIVAVDTVGTGVTYTVGDTGKSLLESSLVAQTQQYIPTMSRANQVLSIDAQRISGPNPAGIYSVFVTTVKEHDLVVGDYAELASCGPVYSGVWYIVSVPSTRQFVFRHRFNLDFGAQISSDSLPSIDAPVAIRVRKAYSVTSNGDLTSASLNIRTAKTQDGGEPVFQVLNDSIVIRKPDGTILLGVTAGGSFIDIGTVTADEITVGGDIDPNQIVRVGTNVSPAFQGIWAGNANPNSAEFSVDLDGNLVASNANISGTIQAAAGSIGGWTIGATQLYSSSIYLANGGRLQIGNSAEITNQDGVTTGNNVFYIDDEQGMWIGNADIEQAPFRVNLDGSILANNATITDLSVDSLRMDGRIRFGTTNGRLQSFQVLTSDLNGVAAQWNEDGLQISDGDITNSNRLYINGSQIQILGADGETLNAITAEGINASTIRFGALPGGSNLIPNSSFEFAPFSLGANGTPNNTAGVGTTFNITETGNTTTGFTMVLSNYGY